MRPIYWVGWIHVLLLALAACSAGSPQAEEQAAGAARGELVVGAVFVAEDRCCTGGRTGDPLDLVLTLNAASPAAPVSEMRIAVGGPARDEAAMAEVPWEPFTLQKIITIAIPARWQGNYVSVQFRDAAGNLSPVVTNELFAGE